MSARACAGPRPGAYRAMVLATLSFALCFSVWGLVAPLAPQFQELYWLSNTQISIVIATPVILGSLFRIPLGLITDWLGGRVVFTGLMLAVTVPVLFIGLLGGSFGGLLFWGFLLGLAGAFRSRRFHDPTEDERHQIGNCKEVRAVLSETVHVVHVVLAGLWLGGVVFTTTVVSPALNAMKWSEAERVEARSAIGRQYARVGSANLVLLLVFAVVDGALGGFGAPFYAEYLLLLVLFGLTAAHGAYFGRRLVRLAGAEREAGSADAAKSFAEQRRSLQRRSLRVSQLNLSVSVVVMVLAAIAQV